MAQFTYNDSKHSTTKTTPSEALFGLRLDLRANVERINAKMPIEVLERAKKLNEMRSILRENIEHAKAAMKKYADKKRTARTYAIGDRVMLRTKNIATTRPSRKLDNRQLGPFKIIDIVGSNAYTLKLPPTYRQIHPTFHVSLLEPFSDPQGKHANPPGPEDNGEWEVEKILQERIYNGKHTYLVKWKGWSVADATWEPEDALHNAPKVLETFLIAAKKREQGYPNSKRARIERPKVIQRDITATQKSNRSANRLS
jgi:hypothetical protein